MYRTVNVEGFVAYRQNFYSVPWRHIGQRPAGAHHRDEVIVYGPHLEEIARHSLLPAPRSTGPAQCATERHRRPTTIRRQR